MRIVSLCPSLTELVFDLGLGDCLVGRTKFCVHPSGDVERVEKVGGTKNPKVERIVELSPDLVLLNEEENRREDADELAAAGIPLHASLPRDIPGTADMVRSIGRALDRADRAESIATDIERRAARVRRGSAGRDPVSFAYLIWRDPIMVAGADTFVHALLANAGGRNAFGALSGRYPEIDADALGDADPDAVLLSSEPFPFRDSHRSELADCTGLPSSRFHFVDGELLSWHGSRTPAGIDYAEHVIRGIESRSAG